jgi:F-type H+-transporting ATPase subunit gamma
MCKCSYRLILQRNTSALIASNSACIDAASHHLPQTLYNCMLENNCSEQSSRMNAMENSTKNAGEMLAKLTLTYNRTRQASITTELIEIISGATALAE